MSTPSHALQVKGMSCQHCVKAVTKAVQAQDPAAQVQIDLPTGMVTVTTDLPRNAVQAAIEAEGYEVQA